MTDHSSCRLKEWSKAVEESEKSPTEDPARSLHNVVVVIPAFRVERYITAVITRVPPIVQTIVAVEDHSPDSTCELLDRLRTGATFSPCPLSAGLGILVSLS